MNRDGASQACMCRGYLARHDLSHPAILDMNGLCWLSCRRLRWTVLVVRERWGACIYDPAGEWSAGNTSHMIWGALLRLHLSQ